MNSYVTKYPPNTPQVYGFEAYSDVSLMACRSAPIPVPTSSMAGRPKIYLCMHECSVDPKDQCRKPVQVKTLAAFL